MENKKREGNLLVVIALFIFMGMQPTIIAKTISSFMTPMYVVSGVSTTAFSGMISISGLFAGLLAPVTAKLINSMGIKKLLLVSSIITVVAYYAITFVDASNSWLLYVIGLVNGIGQVGLSQVVISTIVTSWYPGKEKGTMLGIVMAGSNTFNFIFVNVIGYCLATFGNEFYVTLIQGFAALMAVVSIPLVLFVIRLNPAVDTTSTKKVETTETKEEVKEEAAPVEVPGMTMKEAQKTAIFWLFCFALVFLGIVVTGVQMHTNTYLQLECGADAATAGSIWSIAAPCAVISNLGMGWSFSKFGPQKTMTVVSFGWVACTVCLLLSASNITFAPIAVGLYGLVAATATVAPAFLTNVMFGQKEYAAIFGFVMMLFFLGCTLGSVVTAIIANAAGYTTMWLIDIVLVVITFGTFLFAIIKNKDAIEANSK